MKPKKTFNVKVFIIALFCICFILAAVFATVWFFGSRSQSEDTSLQNNTSISTEVQDKVPESTDPSTSLDDLSAPSDQTNPEEQKPDDTTTEGKPESDSGSTTDNKTESISVEEIWNGMKSGMGEDVTANLCLSKDNLVSLYGLDPAICEDFVLYKAGTIVSPEEYFIVKSSSENLSSIEQACQQRQAALAEQWSEYSDFKSMVDEYQIVRSGDYLFFGISPHISQLVGIFQGIMMTQN